MVDKIKNHDFVEIDYTGKLLDGTIFDTTLEKVAQENNISNEKAKYKPAIICVGEKQLLPGLDDQLADKEVGKEYTINISAEDAFGKRDIKKMKIIPMNTFREHKMQPQPGLQINVDGEIGVVSRVSGGRVIVNFNHPLAGKEVSYIFTINRKITDVKEKISSFLNSTMQIPLDKIEVAVADKEATITLPTQLPAQFTDILGKKLAELTNLEKIDFKSSAPVLPSSS